MPRRIPQLQGNELICYGSETIEVGSAAWFGWLAEDGSKSFSYATAAGPVTVRRERKRNGLYWYAYRHHSGTLRKAYLGKSDELTPERLADRVASLVQGNGAASLHLFGPPTVVIEQRSIQLPSAKAGAMLAYLALRHLPLSRAEVIALLWPESRSAAGRKNLRNLLWMLRTTAGQALVEGDERLALNPAVSIDVGQFEQLADRISHDASDSEVAEICSMLALLYRGPLLDGIMMDGAPEAELWLVGERERLHRLYVGALVQLTERYRATGRWAELLPIAHTALMHDPSQETMHCALMEAYAHLGQRSEALRQYETLHATLERELGAKPLPQTEQLREAILRGALLPDPTPTESRVVARHVLLTPYVGRQLERAALDSLWQQAQAGTAHVALLVGEAGIGKSRLWQMWAAGLPPDVPVCEARCLEATRSLPFAPVVELLRGFVPGVLSSLVVGRAQTPSWVADLTRLLPELRDTFPHLPQPQRLGPAEEQRRIFEAVVQSLPVAGGRPLVVIVDDLHWADRATLDWLGYLVHRARHMPLLLIGAYRAEEAPQSLTQLIGSWTRTGSMQRLSLDRLNRAETEALIEALGGDLQRADALYKQSAGNPYFVRELIQSPPDAVPTALVDLISARLDELPDVAREVIQAAAVLQPYSTFATLWRTSDLSQRETVEAIELLVQRGLLVERGPELAFNHPLIAHVVDTHLSGVRRVMLHSRAAKAWLAAEHHEEQAGRLAIHYREAGDTAQAAHYAEQAGDQALALGALVEASQFYELALALEPSVSRHHGQGLARYWQGDLKEAQGAFTTALEEAVQANDLPSAGRACLELARTALSSGQSADVIHWVTLGRSYLTDENDPSALAMAAYLLGTGMRINGQSLADAEAQLYEALAFAEAAQAETLVPGIFFELGNVRAQRGDLPQALDYFNATISAAERNNDMLHIVLGHNNAAHHATLMSEYTTAYHHIEQGLALIEERNMEVCRQWLYSTRGELALAEHQLDAAENWFERGIAEAERYNNSGLLLGYRANLARIGWKRGDLGGALGLLQGLIDEASQLPDQYLTCQIELWLAELQMLRGHRGPAATHLDRAERCLTGRDYALLQSQAAQLRMNVGREM